MDVQAKFGKSTIMKAAAPDQASDLLARGDGNKSGAKGKGAAKAANGKKAKKK